jgi:alkaline phosphatase D
MKKSFPVFLLAFFLMSCSSSEEKKSESIKKTKVPLYGLENSIDKNKFPFYHGIASGDPLKNAVIIWTRVTPEYHQRVEVKWQMALEPHMSTIVQSGEIFVDSVSDYTVKVDVHGLQPGQHYYYRFEALGKKSPVGRTKTLPKPGVTHIRLAFASCSDFAWGYFHAYDLMAKDTLDAVIHLGDYIYEHEPGVYEAHIKEREHIPAKELITLTDYRTRYAQYRLDHELQEVHASHPFITVWDDHELANNAYDEGAQNHQPNEGDWNKRKEAAERAYYEWMPVRTHDRKLYRAFDMGGLANLIMLDTRVEGRDKQVGTNEKAYKDTTRKIIDQPQFSWLEQELGKPFKWKIIGNQVLFGSMEIFFSPKGELYTDGWDDYPYQKNRLGKYISKLNNVVFVTGDFHSSFALKNMLGRQQVAMEYVVPSISSANYDEDMGLDSAMTYTERYRKANKNLLYVNLVDHGYMVLDINENQAKGIFKYVNTVTGKEYTQQKDVVIPYEKK